MKGKKWGQGLVVDILANVSLLANACLVPGIHYSFFLFSEC